ncbi:hypothetical protein IID24_01025 [Patescibacteria group bacterium]|nr:hypothetical protein [Patescibacteria group bacterium]
MIYTHISIVAQDEDDDEFNIDADDANQDDSKEGETDNEFNLGKDDYDGPDLSEE